MIKPIVFSLLLIQSGLAAPTLQSIEDLKSVQTQINAVVKKVLPATVSLFSTKNGASGSGVIVREDGLILTAAHVVDRAEEMTVIFPNGKQARGKVLGAHYTRDSAMIQILDESMDGNWPYVEIGHSKSLTSGDLVLALGHAGGYDPKRSPPVRFGRFISHEPNKFISTDCTLIAGDSGGPLFDLNGRLIGIHSSIGAALASNNHASIEGFHDDWNKLKKGETWGQLGGSDPDTPVIGIITGGSSGSGININHVMEGSPAAKADLRVGDSIQTVNGRSVPNSQVLIAEISKQKPGDIIKIQITRDSKTLTRKVILTRRGDLIKP